jgi:biopolymer transport protein TolQ
MPFADPAELFGSLGVLSIVILMILSVFSVVSWGIIVNKFRRFRQINQEEAQFLQLYDVNPADQLALRTKAQTFPLSPSATVYLGVTDRLPSCSYLFRSEEEIETQDGTQSPNRDYLEKVTQYIIQSQINHQEAYLPFLATTGNITPFVGLLGTVLGIINAFGEIGTQGSASIAAVAPGVSEALVATAAGLFAAIPAVIAYNRFSNQVERLETRYDNFTEEFSSILQRQAHALTGS